VLVSTLQRFLVGVRRAPGRSARLGRRTGRPLWRRGMASRCGRAAGTSTQPV